MWGNLSFYTSYFACDWMVCLQDSPGQKASFALDLFVPAGIDTLSIGVGLPQKVLPNGLVLHRWRSTRPYSAYLFGFAVGTFSQQSAKTTAGTFVYLDGTGQGANLAAAFQQTPSIAAFFAQAAGIALPDGRYTQLLVPGQEAQEAATFSLIGVQALQDEQEDPASSWIIAHEMAHQWWGNLVTCASWQDFWLNEGITTFMVAAWKQHAFGEAAYQQELDEARRRLAVARDAGFDKPLAWSGEYPSLRVRRAVQYSKGALFMAHLRQTLGERAFWAGMRRYTRKNVGRTVVSHDLQVAMEHSSGRDLSALFAQWVYGDEATN
ncbi:M1 family aminopeptidase [Xanthomonas campestris]|uniref:M1 family aminopeptidase n=1 Tax=Xanthomonas campestris TaxID=339 RepID=UPI0023680A0A|nr:M1 family aminopeptidase [Xanthomonas campestris]